MKGGVEWLGAIGKESRSSGIASLADSGLWSVNYGLRMECEKEVIEGTFLHHYLQFTFSSTFSRL